MSFETLSLIQKEVHGMREYFTKQEEKIQTILAEALAAPRSSSHSPSNTKESDNEKLKELQEALVKSKAAARAADGKIKLLQYQLAKSKSNNWVMEQSTTSASAVPNVPVTKKVSFEDEIILSASQDWLKHWLRMKSVGRDIAFIVQEATNSENNAEIINKESEANLSVHESSHIKVKEDVEIVNIDLEISRCSDMGNILDELGVLSESFVTSAVLIPESSNEADKREESHISKDCANTVSEEKSDISVQYETVAEENEFVIPKAFCDKLFSPISAKDTESIQTATSKFDTYYLHSSANSSAVSVASKLTISNKTTTSSSSISLREYMAMKNKKFSEERPTQSQSPCSVMQSQYFSCDYSPITAAMEDKANDNNMTMFSPQTHVNTIATVYSGTELKAQRKKSSISPGKMIQFPTTAMKSTSEVTRTPAPHTPQEHNNHRYLPTSETVSSLGHSQLTPSVFQFTTHNHSHIQQTVQKSSDKKINHLLYTISSKKSVKSVASDIKTISRLFDCGSSFITENSEDEREISCHTLTTEFDLLHNYRAPTYETLRRLIIDVEQPLFSAKMVKETDSVHFPR